MSEFRPREGQKKVLGYSGGWMGISAVPGSGKTRTLAELAALLVAGRLGEGEEVLVVTLVNSAVDSFKKRINEAIDRRNLLPGFGYRVRTLHSLAHDIVRERPGLVNLSDDFGIIDERAAATVLEDTAEAWLRAHPDFAELYLGPELEENRVEWVKQSHWPSLVRSVAAAFVKRAKDLELGPEVLIERLAQREAAADAGRGTPLPLARMGAEIYAGYQRSLAYRGVVDFDDLIRLALQALRRDEDYLARLRQRWPYVLEDEAQDSSELQERILRLLAGKEGNWVRVGDVNQAIYDTFTTANPRYLNRFLSETGVLEVKLPESGRSQPAIIELANYLVKWTQEEHPTPEVRGAFRPLPIVPTGPGDPQPNPPRRPEDVVLVSQEMTAEAELKTVVDSVEGWLADNAEATVAILAPINERGVQITRALQQRGLPYLEMLRSTSVTRQTAGALGNLLRCLADPTSARKLSVAFQVWRREGRQNPDAQALTRQVVTRIAGCPAVEAYLWPRADHDWLAPLAPELGAEEYRLLVDFREMARRWHRAAVLPIDQLILTLAGDLFQEPAELALAHKLAALLREASASHPGYRLPELVEELAVIARNERRFLGFSADDTGFEPPKGKVTVTTNHKAKGLEWDRVYLTSVNNYDFPSGQSHDTYISERWFVRDKLNLEAEALAQLAVLAEGPGKMYVEGAATLEARWSYAAERLRLFYVGITRARRDLLVTWNTGRGREKRQQAAAFAALEHERQKTKGQQEPESE